jgi:transcriptional regulator with XRE-family HTH domain
MCFVVNPHQNCVWLSAMEPERIPVDFDTRVGANIRRIREAKGFSQTDLASELGRRGGLNWPQQTIARVEAGTRPLKFSEAIVVAEILEVELPRLSEYIGNEAIATLATEILQRMSVIARAKKGIEESRERHRRSEEDTLQVIERWTRELRDVVEPRLAEAGAVKNGDGRWSWRNEDGSTSTLTVDV